MKQKWLHIFYFTVLLFANLASIKGQTDTLVTSDSNTAAMDTIYNISDTVALVDTIFATTDTLIQADRLKKEKDTVYYSLYGYILHVGDTLPIEKWNYNTEIHQVEMHTYDSTLDMLHLDHPAYKEVINNNYLGHTGLAAKSNLYFEPHQKSKFIFLQPFTSYTFQADQTEYYNVHSPFTKFAVSIGSNDEQNVNVLHTQNINPYFNAFAHFKSFTGRGQYLRQETRNNATIFGGTYSKEHLTTHISFAFNKIYVQESGGILDTRLITDPSLSETDPGNKITAGETSIKNRQFFFDQKIGFIKARYNDSSNIGGYWFSLQYNYQWDKNMKQYTHDNDLYLNPISEEYHNYYENNYSDASTFDSCSFINNDNLFRLNLEEIPGKYPGFGGYFGLGFSNSDYYYFNKDTLYNNSRQQTIKSNFLEAGIYRLQSKYVKFTGKYRWYTGGYREGDFELSGSIFQDFGNDSSAFILKFEGGLYKETPDLFMKEYYSNHFKWNNDLDAEFSTRFKFTADFPRIRTTFNSNYAIINKYIYFNEAAIPTQHNKALTVFDASLKNKFPFWKFRLVTKLNYQSSSNISVLPLPEISYYGALYLELLPKFQSTGGKIKIQLGADVLYWSEFYAQQYTASLATFGNQSTQLVGNYPFIGGFLDFEIKRLRFYFRGEHLSQGYFENNYFASPGYPSSKLGIRYGLVWTFYD